VSLVVRDYDEAVALFTPRQHDRRKSQGRTIVGRTFKPRFAALSFSPVIVAVGLFTLCRPSLASDKPLADPPDAEIAKLVRHLGSPEFRDRQKASVRLLEIGPTALAALRAGTENSDAEVARRCEGLVVQIRAAERDALITGKKDLPGQAGKRFKELVGDSKAARTLFADMIDDERRAAVAELAATDRAKAAKLYRGEVAWVEDVWKRKLAELDGLRLGRDPERHFRRASQEAIPPGAVVLAFFLGAYSLGVGEPDAPDVEAVLKASFVDLATLGETRPFRKLFATWLENRRDPTALRSGVDGALFAAVPEVVPVARRPAAEPKAPASVLGPALVALGNYGSLEDLPAISSFRSDTRTYQSYKIGNRTLEVQLRDQAAAMSLLIRRTRAQSYGFQHAVLTAWWSDARHFKTAQEFNSDRDREAAHKKAWAWLDQQPKVTPKQ
jgi:hypothetical protein